MLRSLFVLSSLFLVMVSFAFAQAAPYFEFAPKISEPLDIDDQSGEVFEVFLPQNDHLSGIDIWVDNPGPGGEVSVGLRRDGNDSLLAAASFSILGDVQPTFEGKRIHIDFPSQVAVSSDDKYTLKILSEIPDFRVYQTNRRVILLEHTAPYTSEYINGAVRFGNSEQDFGFKFALYETSENVAPVVTNITTAVLSLNEVRFEFNANEPVDFKIQYGEVGGGFLDETVFNGEYMLCSQGAVPCTMTLTVVPDSVYSYTLTVKDEWDNESQLSGTFTSADSPSGPPPPPPDDDGDPPPSPEIDILSPTISNLRVVWSAEDSVKVAWSTNEVANASLRVTEDAEGNQAAITFVIDPIYELEHVLASPANLNPATTYYAHIISEDLNDNASGGSIGFTTLPGPASQSEEAEGDPTSEPTSDEPPPAPATEGGEETASGGGALPPPTVGFSSEEGTTEEGIVSGKGAISFQWQIPKEGVPEDGYRIDVFDESGELVKQIFIDDGNATETKIRGLPPGKYTIIIYSNRGGVFEKIAEPTQIAVLSRTLLEKIIQFWYIYVAVIAVIVVIPWYLIRKERMRLKEVEG